MKKNVILLFACLICYFSLPFGVFAQEEQDIQNDGAFVIGALMKTITIIESEIALQFSFTTASLTQHIDLSKKIKEKSGNDNIPGLVRITGGSMEVMIDIENAFLEESFDEGAVKIYDFTLGSEGEGSSIVVLPEASERSFTLAIGAKAEILSGENIDYFTKNVLSANYL